MSSRWVASVLPSSVLFVIASALASLFIVIRLRVWRTRPWLLCMFLASFGVLAPSCYFAVIGDLAALKNLHSSPIFVVLAVGLMFMAFHEHIDQQKGPREEDRAERPGDVIDGS